MKNRILTVLAASTLALTMSACDDTDSAVVNENLDVAAEQFEINRRIVALNTITDKYIWDIAGRCDISYKSKPYRAVVTCKVAEGNGQDSYRRNTIVLADNVTLSNEQLDPVKASAYHYRVVYKPQTIVPDIDFKGSTSDTPKVD